MSDIPKTVFVLGAGFTKAFYPKAPLLYDDYGLNRAVKKFRGFPFARKLLKREMSYDLTGKGRVDLERLLARVAEPMPYDNELRAESMLAPLRHDLMERFVTRIKKASLEPADDGLFRGFAWYCVKHHASCITFNYDDFFDRALCDAQECSDELHWSPEVGYGFVCRPASAVLNTDTTTHHTFEPALLLLKLHGSLNWRLPKAGVADVVPTQVLFDDPLLAEQERWQKCEARLQIDTYLQERRVMAPPVLVKRALHTEAIFHVLWHQALTRLRNAERTVFIGYSMPHMDLAARTLFAEGLPKKRECELVIVNNLKDTDRQQELVTRFGHVFGEDRDITKHWQCAREWCLQEVEAAL